MIGNPVRAEIAALGEAPRPASAMRGRRLRLLVVGGSLGALALNQRLPGGAGSAVRGGATRCATRPVGIKKRRLSSTIVRRASTRKSPPSSTTWRRPTTGRTWWVCRAGALTVAELAAAANRRCSCPSPCRGRSPDGQRTGAGRSQRCVTDGAMNPI
ncbi:hypothetical protein DSL92_03035 [Billgrantia gudaonensis]|uniref:Uncharacterized protein n=1 Tax=Billgrantia gudaonensis TaxID=376427 RepID=A0A3S0NXA7_9GAMM|nr:hypothetical protein DSL92_03035 [Halomonas gudaonensis]